MELVTMLAMQIGVLLLALMMFWATCALSREALKEAAEDAGRICALLGKGERK